MSLTVSGHGLGWVPDYPDYRDFSPSTPAVSKRLKRVRLDADAQTAGAGPQTTSRSVDLRQWCSPVEDQEDIGSCTANAGVGLIEYFENRAFGHHLDASRLFLYKVTRNLMGWTGDTGAFLRTTMGAMKLFGVPPTQYWPYDTSKFEDEPSAFCYAFASSYQAVDFFRLDPPNTSRDELLGRVKDYCAAHLPVMFGFTVFDSISDAEHTGMIPFPEPGDRQTGGHAVVAVGYDDDIEIKHSRPGSTATKGAILIRNSWGERWGDHGYGWLPYEYVLRSQAIDWWTLISNEYVETGQFGL